MANNRIQNYRGTKVNMPTLKVAELGFATDTRELFIGTSSGNLSIGGSQWYTGTAMSGTSTTTGYYSYSSCPLVKVGDIYLNTSYGYVYQCTTAGSGTAAKWTYKGNIRGKGISSTAITYQSGTSGTSAPTGTWSTSVPSVSQGNYLWTRVVITYTDGTTSTSYSVARQGADGTNGADGDDGQRGSKWFTGIAMSGTSTTTGAYTWNDSEQKYVGDIYLNTSYGYVYKCTTAGSGTTAKWTYQGCIKGANGQDAANYINTYPTSGSFKAVYTNGGTSFYNTSFGGDGGTVIFEGMGRGKTTFGYYVSATMNYNKTIIFKDCTVQMNFDANFSTKASFIFINCLVRDQAGANTELYRGSGNLTFLNSEIQLSNAGSDPDGTCLSGIVSTGNVTVIGSSVNIDEASGTTSDFDHNFIYSAAKLTMQGVTVTITGTGTERVNIIRNCNDATINGCHFYLKGSMHSIGHIADTDRTVGGSFTGNYVEYYKTYMRFATISGNTFNHLAAGSSSANQIILQCPTCMTGNHFKGSTPYIDAQSQKVIVDRNLTDNTLTVGNAASGSITTNNLQY